MYTTDTHAVASTSAYAYPATKDAAAKEREDRLLAAKKKLKLYRARTNQRMSATSTLSGSGSSPSTSPTKAIRRRSGLTSSISMPSDLAAAKHAHRRSQSKSGLLAAMGGDTLVAATGAHARRTSRSRMSRSSISLKQAGHGHTRSRASISMSFSGPAPPLSTFEPPADRPITPTPRAHPGDRASALSTPSSWLHGGTNGFPASPDPVSCPSPSSNSAFHASPNASLQGAAGRHGRHGSRHARQSSVSNFRESIDMISGGSVVDAALLRPSISSFAEVASSPAASPFVPNGGGWSNDPQQLLAALKERGRRESDDFTRSPEQTRQSALEALEGRLAAPTDMISLGDAEPGEMLAAARSPGKLHATSAVSAAPRTPAIGSISSPMLGLGMGPGHAAGGANKRGSWGPGLAQPPSATVAQGVMELGEIAEEDEEDEETRSLRGSTFGDSPRRRVSRARSATSGSSPQSSISSISRTKAASPSPRKSRPLSLLADTTPSRPPQLGAVAEEDISRDESHRDDSQASPASSRRSSMRPLSLSGFSRPASPSASRPAERSTASPPDIRTSVSPGEKRHVSMFHSAAVSGLNPEPLVSAASGQSAFTSQQQQQRGGLRSLSMGSPTITPERRFSGRPASLIGSGLTAASPLGKPSPSPTAKRSSISYRTDSATPEGQHRAWRNSMAQHSTQSSISPAVSTKTYSSFPFGVSGGFGDLEVDDDDHECDEWNRQDSPSHSRELSAAPLPGTSTALPDAQEELSALRNKLADLDLRNSQLESTHAAEVAELERKASDAASDMRARISELEQQVEAERSGRRFEVEGLQREVEMTKETIEDLVGERDALRDDVEGWRSRCSGLEAQVKKEREDDALAQAQAKLIGEMRDQIYTLVAALERERGEHAETRKEVERILEDRVREAAADVQHHHRGGPSAGGASTSSTSSHAYYPSAIKYASPPPGAPATLKQPRPDELALVMEMEEVDDDDQDHGQAEQRNHGDTLAPISRDPYHRESDPEDDASSNPPRHGAMTASNGSLMSTLSSSFGQSYSGNTTEDTSLTTDVDDSYSAKYSSPPSGPPSFANSPFPPPARGRDSDVIAVALGQLDTLAEEEEEDVDASAAFEANMSAASQTTPIADNSAAAARDSLDSTDQTTSASSDALPTTPDRPTAPEQHHRSRSFVRQWSFPKGSVSSSRPSFEDEDRSFFGYNKHDSLPPLPISEHILPPFLSSTLDIEDATVSFLPAPPVEGTVETANHVRRPSSPRPLDRMNPHARRLSAQHRPPPPSPSALVTVALQHQQHAPLPQHGYQPSQASTGSLDPSPVKSRYSFGALIGTIGGWSPAASSSASAASGPGLPPRASLSSLSTPSKASHMSINAGPLIAEEADEGGVEEDVYVVSSHAPAASAGGHARPPARGGMPPQLLQHQGHRLRPIARHEVPMPRAGRLAQLDFSKSACCMDQPVFVV
ncbi:hypothetical protein JCM3774_005844 [Rhodotorula dairenensis]